MGKPCTEPTIPGVDPTLDFLSSTWEFPEVPQVFWSHSGGEDWCPGQDSNLQAFRQRLLRPSCLPIPPPGRGVRRQHADFHFTEASGEWSLICRSRSRERSLKEGREHRDRNTSVVRVSPNLALLANLVCRDLLLWPSARPLRSLARQLKPSARDLRSSATDLRSSDREQRSSARLFRSSGRPSKPSGRLPNLSRSPRKALA